MIREKRIQQIIEEASRPPEPALEANNGTKTEEGAPKENPPRDEKTPGADAEKSDEQDDDESKDDEAKEEDEDKPEEPEAEPVAEPTVAAYSMAATVPERIRRYVEATGEAPSPDEVRWLLTNWVDGPTLLMLNDNFQRFRANQRPVFNILDRDRDGTISSEELADAVKLFDECDLNRNGIVSYTEIARVADGPRLKKAQHAGPGKLVFRIPDQKTAAATYRRIAARYAAADKEGASTLPRFDLNSNGQFDADELTALRDAEPDLSLTIAFVGQVSNLSGQDEILSYVKVTAVSSTFAEAAKNGTANESSITLPIGGTTVSFSAVQSGPSDQISIGAVNDGYPILPVVDPNEDGRFTIRELRGLVASLREFDRNEDGSLTHNEAQSTIRICFGLGPHVHRELAELRSVKPKPDTPTVTGPDWFVRMDRNKDNDLIRGEFPGTDEQFRQLDADNDALISAKEATDFDRKSGNAKSDETGT